VEHTSLMTQLQLEQVLKKWLTFLEKTYKNDLSLDDASALAAAGIYLSSEDKEGSSHIRMAHIKTKTGLYEILSNEQIANFAKIAKEKYPHEQK